MAIFAKNELFITISLKLSLMKGDLHEYLLFQSRMYKD